MSDADYNDLFNSDPAPDESIRTTDETQLAINSIVDCGAIEQQENPIDISESANFFFDDLDIDNHHQDNNQNQDDEASRAVQNLLGFSWCIKTGKKQNEVFPLFSVVLML